MKKAICAVAVILACTIPARSRAQETQAGQSGKSTMRGEIPLRVQILITESDGDKKVASLPYMFTVNTNSDPHGKDSPQSMIRDGVRVPLELDKNGERTYQDIGTNIDCSVVTLDNGLYKMDLRVQHSTLTDQSPNPSTPVIRQFRADTSPIMRDGVPYEAVMATDPLNGHVFRVTATLSVMK